MDLQIKHNGNDWVDVGEMELTSLLQSLTSQAAGSLTLTYDVEIDGDYRFDHADSIQLRGRNDSADSWTILFVGLVSGSPIRSFGVGSATDSVIVKDAWNDLSQVAFQRTQFTSEAYNKSHVIMFRDSDGDRMTCGAQAKEILDYAITQGAALQYIQTDLTSLTVEPPADEVSDLLCSEALVKCLKWQMDVFTWFDFSTTPPTIRFQNSDNEADRLINVSEAVSSGGQLSIQRNDDKALRGVVINYEIENEIIDGTTQEVQTDQYGDVSGKNVLVQTCSLDGSYVENSESSIYVWCSAFPADWQTNESYVQALLGLPPSQCCGIDSAGVTSGTVKDNYVTSGYQPGYDISVESVTLWWDIEQWWYRIWRVGIGWEWQSISECGYRDWDDNYATRIVRFSKTFLMTNSPSGTYNQTTQVVKPGESVPAGVAEAIYNARHWPLHSGVVSVEIKDLASVISPRNNISIEGSLPEYKDMRAPVQFVTRNWMSDLEQVKFGYPDQAGVSNFVDMLRANRDVSRPLRRTWKTS